MDSQDGAKGTRLIIVSNHLPVRVKGIPGGWDFEWDEDALVAQAKDGISEEFDVLYVGCLPVEIDGQDQEKVAQELRQFFNCAPVFLGSELKEKYYKGFCKQQLWPLFHYVLPMAPQSSGRFDLELWQAYVKANKAFADKVVEESATDTDFVWIHDYHLLVLPSLLRKRFNRIRCGVFLHSPFPSSEIFRTFPKREELLRSLLNSDLIGFHTFDYARHFLSCCSRMLGLEHETARGSITIEYYGRTVGLKIMPTGVNPGRLLSGFEWPEFKWRRGELVSQFAGKTVLVAVDDMDVFKGIELKLLAFERLLDHHPDRAKQLVLVQITNSPRAANKDTAELHAYVLSLVTRINAKHGTPTHEPVYYLERHVPLHERIAFYACADVAVVTATRDGMNLVPYEYVTCRQGPDGDASSRRDSMLVVSEFVGCSPSLSGAIRVNPWSIESVADGMYAAIKIPMEHKRLRHEKHWRYVSHHTVAYWAQSYVMDLQRFTKHHVTMKCYGLGLGLDTYRMVALDANFKKLEDGNVQAAYTASSFRLFFLDYDGTLTTASAISAEPSEDVTRVLGALTADPANRVYIISGRPRATLEAWFRDLPNVGLAAEHGFYLRPPGSGEWEVLNVLADFSWQKTALPILKQYQESTDGSTIESKESALVWQFRDADPDFGNWQAKELMDHLEDVLSNKPIEVVSGSTFVEIKPQGVSKGRVVERILAEFRGQPTKGPTPRTSGGAAAVAAAAAAAAAGGPPGMASMGAAAAGADGAASAALGAGTPLPLPPRVPRISGGAPAAPAAPTGPAPSFILCIGDDRSDEDMFNTIEHATFLPYVRPEVFACVVGQKPSKAPFYLNDAAEVLSLLAKLAGIAIHIPLPM